uniref:Lon proteolytic domain-containing protein n=1 Tax=Meloidogyne enterolobii TaxID=390850 RepID=A0A6V7V5Z3_MELEN|nr:unnamed protein product [Meloidogyne enterolobii]
MGEIWVDGTVHKVGGLIPKLMGAKKLGVEFIILPAEMEEEHNSLTDEQKQGITSIFISNFEEIFPILFPTKKNN